MTMSHTWNIIFVKSCNTKSILQILKTQPRYMIQCRNCGHKVHDKYCSFCGQKSTVGRISLGMLIRELPHAIFHVESGILYNFTNLFKRPGKAISEYLSG